MTGPRPAHHESRGATVAQLRADIDSGRTGDKVAAIDHAAAPLGTDEEAAGTPVSAEIVAMVRQRECKAKTDATTIGTSKTIAYWALLALPALGFIVGLVVIMWGWLS